MTLTQKINMVLENRKDRSAWDKGVTAYALELVESLEERTQYEHREPQNNRELEQWLLNGAQDWKQYSLGGSSLIYDCDIAERTCNPTELKRTHGGEKDPNHWETWLDVQARALYQACNRIKKIACVLY